jgi:hypothetical protein
MTPTLKDVKRFWEDNPLCSGGPVRPWAAWSSSANIRR